MGQLPTGGGVYLPDYSVRQLTDLQIIKVTHKLSYIEKKAKNGSTSKNVHFKKCPKNAALPLLQRWPLICCNPIDLHERSHPVSRSALHTLLSPLITKLHFNREYLSLK